MSLSKGQIHGLLMMLSLGWLLPLGVLSARFLKHRPNELWFSLHCFCQGLGVVLGVIGFSIAVTNFHVYRDDPSSTSFQHGVLGATVLALVLLQPLLAFVRPDRQTVHIADAGPATNSAARTRWERVHKGMGYTILLLTLVTILLGAKMEGPRWILAYLLGVVGSLGLAYGLVWYDRFSYQPPLPSQEEIMIP